MKHIVIDARLYGPTHTGIGRYAQNLLMSLDKLLASHPELRLTLITYPNLVAQACQDLPHFQVVGADIPHYSILEQFKLPLLLHRLKPDLVHFTHFNKSILYTGRSVVTIHDLIKHFSKGKDTTTRSPMLYWPKYWAYKLLVWIVINTSKIIVPSNFWRDHLVAQYHLNPTNIVTTYEAVDPKFINSSFSFPASGFDNYILYTGNLYPHKNLKVILKALKLLPDLKLKIICARSDVFTQRIKDIITKYDIAAQVEFLGFVPDANFPKVYAQALALVHPAYMEGFSLTGLEAMALNCPVIASTASCLPEIYGDSVLYFDPDSPKELVTQINKLQNNPKLRQDIITKGHTQVAKYSWDKTARETLNFYLKILK